MPLTSEKKAGKANPKVDPSGSSDLKLDSRAADSSPGTESRASSSTITPSSPTTTDGTIANDYRSQLSQTPNSGLSAWFATAFRQYRLERRVFWRNPSAAFFNFVLPLLFLAFFGAIFANKKAELDVIVPGIAGMSVMSTTFSALAFNLTFLREQGVLKRVRGTPLSSSAYLSGLVGSAITNTFLQIAIITVSGNLVFGVDWPQDWGALFIFVVAGVCCFASLGVALSHAIPNFEAAPAYVNAVFLPTIFISGVFFDAEKAPQFLMTIAEILPLKHLIEGLSGAMVTGTGISSNLTALAILGVWTIVGLRFAVRGFCWEARRT